MLKTVPGVGPVTIDVVVSELGDITRFRNAKAVCAYAGLAPIVRQTGARSRKDLGYQQGSGLLRWALVEAAWRIVRTAEWKRLFERIGKPKQQASDRRMARDKLLCVMLRDAQSNDAVPGSGHIAERANV